jgi:hypothetical protein
MTSAAEQFEQAQGIIAHQPLSCIRIQIQLIFLDNHTLRINEQTVAQHVRIHFGIKVFFFPTHRGGPNFSGQLNTNEQVDSPPVA